MCVAMFQIAKPDMTNPHIAVAASLARLARYLSRRAVQEYRAGDARRAGVYRECANWHLGKARDRRDMADALDARRITA